MIKQIYALVLSSITIVAGIDMDKKFKKIHYKTL